MIEDKLNKQELIKQKTIDYEYSKKEKLLEKEYELSALKEIKIKKETKDIDSEHLVIRENQKRQVIYLFN